MLQKPTPLSQPGKPGQSMAIQDNPGQSMAIQGNLWKSRAIQGNLWQVGHSQKCKANRWPDCFAKFLAKMSANNAKRRKGDRLLLKGFFLLWRPQVRHVSGCNWGQRAAEQLNLKVVPAPQMSRNVPSTWIQIRTMQNSTDLKKYLKHWYFCEQCLFLLNKSGKT